MRGVERPYDTSEESTVVACTACALCMPHCPENIRIPKMLTALNNKRAVGFLAPGWDSNYASGGNRYGKASDCTGCGACERVCPQHLPIPKLLKELYDEAQ